MNKIYLLLVCCLMSLAASAASGTYYPISVSAPYSGTAQTVCQNSTSTATSVTYSVCGTYGAVGTLTVTAVWYLNGTAVYTDPTPHLVTTTSGGTISLAAGAIPYTSYGSYTGANGLYCVLSWTGASPAACGTTTSVAGTPTNITVNQAPGAILGASNVCNGYSTTLSNTVTPGIWSSSNSTIANVNFSSGVVTGSTVGVVHITYTLGSGCLTTSSFTVNQTPANITGLVSVCTGTLSTLSDLTTGGTWTSSNTAVATIGSGTGTTGDVVGVSAGTTIISYALTTGCMATTNITVNQSPAAITGATTVCTGDSIALTDATPGGVWTSSSTGVATVNFTNGVVTGVTAAGTFRISYELSSGCYTTTGLMTVNSLPATISGVASVCVSALTSLSDATAGGFWSASNSNVVIGTGSGYITGTGATAGLDTMYYTLSTGCARSVVVTVNPLPAAISGADSVCKGSTTSLSDAGGGTWSSVSTAVATISTAGVVTGVAAGQTTVTYKLPTGCISYVQITVNALPTGILGSPSLCVGYTTTLSDLTSGGTWSSSNAGVASIGSGTGVVGGASAGTSVISYKFTVTGCATSLTMSINATPPAISGATSVCVGTSTGLSDATGGGTWSSSNTAIATISAAGLVTGIANGVATISYIVGSGCFATSTITVNANPAAITGIAHVCAGSVTTLTDASTLGTWTSSNTAVALIVDAFGDIQGISAGTSIISYTVGTGCAAATVLTVNPLPAAIAGGNSVCTGSTLSLSDGTTGGTWTSSSTVVATIGSSTGTLTGVAQGTDVVNYVITATGCLASKNITVNPVPASISGNPAVCVGSLTTLSDGTGGGTWTSSNTAKAVVDGSGDVSGVAVGTATITYTLGTGCNAKVAFSVNAVPGSINGLTSVCAGSTISLTDGTLGGTWSSSNTSVATISSAGVVTGQNSGVVIMSYILSTGCFTISSITVNELPSPIYGVETVCAGSTTSLSNAVSGGIWTSGTTTVATIGLSTGTVNGASAGTTNIAYTLGTGCKATAVVTVYALPATISGLANVCIGSTITLSDNPTGGTWSSSNTSVAPIGPGSGAVIGEMAGTATMTYTLPTGCMNSITINVNPLPTGIVGPSAVCVAATAALTDPTPGGVWTSSATSFATVGTSSGIVTGVSGGTANITYTLSTGCDTTVTMTVNPLPAAISGPTSVCQGQTITLSDGAFSGSWLSSNTTVATVGTSGIVTGVAAGTATITFMLNATGCFKTATVTVHQLPSHITGDTVICQTPATGLADLTTGGTWTSSNTTVASISLTSGLVTPAAAGTTTITYTLGTCYTTQNLTVNPNPSPIAGASTVCSGMSTTLSDATINGTWTSSDPSIANVNATTGVVTGVLAGSVNITYVLNTGCVATLPFTVGALPANITGTSYLCQGTTTVLHDATCCGSWSSSNITVATVLAPGSGSIQGNNPGTAIISYIPATGCIATLEVTVNGNPGAITGKLSACVGDTVELGDTSNNGEWTSSHIAIATVGALSGVVTGVAAGSTTVTYTLGTGCYSTAQLTVNPTPAAISGPANVCEGSGINLTDPTSGGIWSSAETAVATVGAANGSVIAQNIQGQDTIYYTLGGVCSVYKVINVNVTPDTIMGNLNLCSGSMDTLNDGTVGGTWTSGNPSIATIGLSSGIVTGVTGGYVTITYTLGSGCFTTIPDTINTTPSAIMGAANVCPQLTISLSDAIAGGTWSSSNPSLASVNDTTGLVTGIGTSGGSVVISYIISTTGCGVATTVNVNSAPPVITGNFGVCLGGTTSLSDVASGGIWTSSNTTIAPVGESTGIVSGINTGTAVITYELLSSGCLRTVVATVNPLPAPIAGISNVCTNATITLSDSPPLGSWSSSNTLVATVGSVTGIVSGVDSGYTTITYTLGTGCYVTDLIRGNLSPSGVNGDTMLCAGSMISLSDATTFGTWSSSNTAVATINMATGNVSGLSSGTTVITYLLGTGCFAQKVITINPLPAPITGPALVCIGSTIFLSDNTSGGVWTITNPALGTVDASGNVTGVAAGNDTVIYTLPATGCLITRFLTISDVPSPVSGSDIVCAGSVDTLTSIPAGGIWSSSSTLIATVGSGTGYVLGQSSGVAIITYTALSGCNAVAYVTVNPVPSIITGVNNLCPGLTTTLFDTTAGGFWSSTNTAIATLTPTGTGATATLASVLSGTTTISYTIGDGCAATILFTVDPVPYVGTITGTEVFCLGTSSTLADSVAGGIWSSSNTSVATIGSTGTATSVSVGTATVSYIVTEQCGMDTATATIQVTPLPFAPAISGPNDLCLHSSATLSDGATGGVWNSTDTNTVTINATSGLVYGSNAGTSVISYTYTNSCGSYTATEIVSVNATFGFATIVTFPDTPMCSQTFNQNFGAMLPAPEGILYTWSVSQGDSVIAVGAYGQYALVDFNVPGRAVVTLSAEIISSGCVIADSFVTNVSSSVSSDPGVKYYLNEFACTDNTQSSYQWGYDDIVTLDSTLLVGETNQTYYNPYPDTLSKNYWVITTKNGCSQKSYYNFSTTTAVVNINSKALDVRVFPNPADSRVNIVVDGLSGAGVAEVKLFDMFGKEIQTVALVNGKGMLDVSELPAAMYSVLVFDNGMRVGAKTFVKN